MATDTSSCDIWEELPFDTSSCAIWVEVGVVCTCSDNVVTVTEATTISDTYDFYAVDCTAGSVVMSLPDASTMAGQKFTIKKIDSTNNLVILTPTVGQTVDGKSTYQFSNQYDVMTVIAIAGVWEIYSKSFTEHVLTVTANQAVSYVYDTYAISSSGGAVAMTLPTAVGANGQKYTFKKTDTSTNLITITPNGAETIDGMSSLIMISQYERYTIQSNGTNWIIYGV